MLYYERADHSICEASDPGAIPYHKGGLQEDDRYLYVLDLDSHRPDQNAHALLVYGLNHIPAELGDRLVIIPTKRSGYHIPFYSPIELTPGRIYDPRTQAHAGELLDQRIEAVEGIPTLSTIEVIKLLYYFPVPGAISVADGGEPAPTTRRKEYLEIGRSLVAGWERIRDARQRLDDLCSKKPMLATYRAKLRTSTDRSKDYGNLVQSLMLHAGPLGRDTGERCMAVMAMAISVGAGGKEAEKDYRIEKDTSVLIAKILDGAPMQQRPDGTIPHWTVPKWYTGEQLAKPVCVETPQTPRPAHRPTGDRKKAVARLEKLIRRWLDDSPSGRIHYYIDDLADDLGCSKRSAQNYLHDLEEAGKIRRGQVGGRGGRAYFDVLPAFWDANKSKQAPQTDAEPDSARDASEIAPGSVPMPESDNQDVQCIEVLRAPKACAPAFAAGLLGKLEELPKRIKVEETGNIQNLENRGKVPEPDEWAGVESELAVWLDSSEGQRFTAQRHAVDPVVYARVDAIVRGRPAPPGYTLRSSGQRWCLIAPDGRATWHLTRGAAIGAAHAHSAQRFGVPKPAPDGISTSSRTRVL